MAIFNTDSLRKIVFLSKLMDDLTLVITLSTINVKLAKYDGVTYKEGTIPLNIDNNHTIMLTNINHLEHLLQAVWRQAHIQIGIKDSKPVLFVYED